MDINKRRTQLLLEASEQYPDFLKNRRFTATLCHVQMILAVLLGVAQQILRVLMPEGGAAIAGWIFCAAILLSCLLIKGGNVPLAAICCVVSLLQGALTVTGGALTAEGNAQILGGVVLGLTAVQFILFIVLAVSPGVKSYGKIKSSLDRQLIFEMQNRK